MQQLNIIKKHITKWQNLSEYTTLEKFQKKYRNADTMIPLKNTFENELDISIQKKKSLDQIIKELWDTTDQDMVNTLGIEFIFTKISADVKSIFVNRDPLKQIHKKSTVASFFYQEMKHDLNNNIFPKEDIFYNKLEANSQYPIKKYL